MKIHEVQLRNFQCFSNQKIRFSKKINLVVGPNNSGKTCLLKSIAWVQKGMSIFPDSLRLLERDGHISIHFDKQIEVSKAPYTTFDTVKLEMIDNDSTSKEIRVLRYDSRRGDFVPLRQVNTVQSSEAIENIVYIAENREPENYIYFHSSKRKAVRYSEVVNIDAVRAVLPNFENLHAKVDRISSPSIPANARYVQACRDILGFVVTAEPSRNGKKASYVLSNFKSIPLESMGEGVASLLGIISDLCIAEEKIFLIEEPENDLHPKALKKLLELIAEKSNSNQFLITTHSNVVLKYLGSQPESKVFKVTVEADNKIPTSNVEEISSPEDRRAVLEELGYELFDVDLYSAWLFLEESTAEFIIRRYLIPFFAPKLQNRLRTFSAHSISEVTTKFDTFNRLFVYLHLHNHTYKNLVWVIVDGGDKEREVIQELRDKYVPNGWKQEQFSQFSQHDFERYYPEDFQIKVDNILCGAMQKRAKQEAKKKLFDELKDWLEDNREAAKEALEKSASEVIEILRTIEARVVG